jgi:mono/diheme cytochrome c family protein
MPNFGFTDEEKLALTMLVMSWKKVSLPAEYIPVKKTTAQNAQMDKSSSAQTASADLVKRGEEIFKQKCTACHQIENKLVGPALKGLFERRKEDWVLAMIINPDSMIKNDPIAKNLYEEYKVPMVVPGGITQEEAKAVVEYLKTATK